MISPALRRGLVVLVAAAAGLVATAGPALAHVEVEARPAQALATNALLSMSAEAESDSAGITGVRIQLPAGLLPGDLRLAGGPAGWRLTGSGDVVTVRGPALPVGRSLQLGLRVRQLPAGRQLVLKTVQSYSDGHQDAWIEVPSASVPVPDQPAPVVRLAPAAAGATPLPRETTAAPSATPSAAAPTTAVTSAPATSAAPDPAAATQESGGNGVGWLFGGVAVGIILLGAIVLAARRRMGPPTG